MAELPKIVVARMARQERVSGGVSHPDADLLTAYVEQVLSAPEREQIVLHLAACGDCREVLALAAPALVADPAAVTNVVTMPARSSWFPVWRWGAVAAVAVITIGGVMIYRQQPSGVTLEPNRQTASSKTPDVQPPASSQPAEPPTAKTDTDTEKKEIANARPARREVATADRVESAARTGATPAAPKPAAETVATMAEAPAVAKASDQPEVATKRALMDAPKAEQDSVARSFASSGLTAAELHKDQVQPSATSSATFADSSVSQPVSNDGVPLALGMLLQGNREHRLPRIPTPALAAGFNKGVAFNGVAPEKAKALSGPFVTPGWQLSPEGQVQRSFDGRTWQSMTIAPGAHFNSFYATGHEIWAGGSGGVLFHSVDAGETWERVTPAQDMRVLRDDITHVSGEEKDRRKVTLETAGGEFWATEDAGQHWSVHNHNPHTH